MWLGRTGRMSAKGMKLTIQRVGKKAKEKKRTKKNKKRRKARLKMNLSFQSFLARQQVGWRRGRRRAEEEESKGKENPRRFGWVCFCERAQWKQAQPSSSCAPALPWLGLVRRYCAERTPVFAKAQNNMEMATLNPGQTKYGGQGHQKI